MQLDELLKRFNQAWQANPVHDYPHLTSKRPAAVLIASQFIDGELQILFTKRAEHLVHHAGQISFPGGKYEQSDSDITFTALREAEEEIGLATDNVSVIGKLPEFKTISGFEVTPILAKIETPVDIDTQLNIDQNEVAEVFQVPLSYLMDEKNLLVQYVSRNGIEAPVYFIPYKDRYIWGATAGILAMLRAHLFQY